MLTRLAVALVQLAFTTAARVTWGTGAGEAGDAIHTVPMMAGVWGAVVHIVLTQWALKALSTATLIAVRLVHALGSVVARCAGTLIYIQLAHRTTEA